jgi:hypothetical protein
MMDFLKEWEEKLAIKITCSQVFLAPLMPTLVSQVALHMDSDSSAVITTSPLSY